MRLHHLRFFIALAALSCGGGGTEPTPTANPTGLWDVTITGIRRYDDSHTQLLECQAEWVMSVRVETVTSGVSYGATIPLTAPLHCPGGIEDNWIEAGSFLGITQSGDSLVFTRANGQVIARTVLGVNTITGTLIGRFTETADFQATRRSGTDPNLALRSLELSSLYSDLEVADSVQVTAVAYDGYGVPSPATPAWSSSDASIATISSGGLVHAVSPGAVIVTGSVDTLHAQATLTVLTPPASIAITDAPDSIIAPTTVEVTGQARDASGQGLEGRRFHWTSSNPAIASVVEYGGVTTLTPIGAGAVTITARSGGTSAQVDVRILRAVHDILVSGSDGHLTLGGTSQLTVVTRDALGNVLTGRPVTWSSSTPEAVSVTSAGLIEGLRAGAVTISAQAEAASGTLGVQTFFDAPLALVTAGDGHTCGLSAAGTVYCWGHNDGGRLGPGNPASGAPLRVPTPVTFTSLEAGGVHTCGLTASGAPWCWGVNLSGQLGQAGGNPGEILQVGGGHTFTRIEPGGDQTCALTAANAIWCWGGNHFGQLGRGTNDDNVNAAPAVVVGGHQFATVHVGRNYACGITTAAEAWCWGTNDAGQLGLGTSDALPHPTPVHAAPGLEFTALALADQRACGIATDGTVWCWGNDEETPTLTPAQMPDLSGIVSIAAGQRHFCGLTGSGVMSCWSRADSYGLLTYQPSTPVSQITMGLLHACQVPESGKTVCWGLNDGGQLGVGGDTNGPAEVSGQP